jgi:hypothetical protein
MSWSLPWRKRESASSSQLPKESYIALQFESEGLPDLWVVNRALLEFDGRATFPWHLSILIDMQDVIEVGLPTRAEQEVLGNLGEEFGANLKANGNALFLASGTCKGVRHLLYRVGDPEVANAYLKEVVANPAPVRQMDYRMMQDVAWVYAENYLEPARRAGE